MRQEPFQFNLLDKIGVIFGSWVETTCSVFLFRGDDCAIPQFASSPTVLMKSGRRCRRKRLSQSSTTPVRGVQNQHTQTLRKTGETENIEANEVTNLVKKEDVHIRSGSLQFFKYMLADLARDGTHTKRLATQWQSRNEEKEKTEAQCRLRGINKLDQNMRRARAEGAVSQ